MQLSPGVIVGGNYRLEALVGSGGMGAVWRATDVTLGRTVALKVLHTDLRDNAPLKHRFQREARLLAAIEHPAVVPVYAWLTLEDGAGGSYPCIVMPFVKGALLSDVLREQGPLRLEQAAAVLRSLLEALGAAHAAGVIHRDLKPQNIILEQRGGQPQVRLLDFGIAKSLAPPSTTTAGLGPSTEAGVLLGTPSYMSPEQISDPANVDVRTDLWAAGVCFYEMLTGKLPFPGARPVETVSRILSTAPVPVCSVNPGLPPAVEAFFTRILAREPAQRPGSAAEALAMLDGLLASVTGPGLVSYASSPGSAAAPAAAFAHATPPPSHPGVAWGSQPGQSPPGSAAPAPPAQGGNGALSFAPTVPMPATNAVPTAPTTPPATSGAVLVASIPPGFGSSVVPAQQPGASRAISGTRIAGVVVGTAAALGLVGLLVLAAFIKLVLWLFAGG